MDYQCGIINECLHLLKQSSMPTRKRLRLEIQLIGIKKLLVYDRGISKNIEHWPNGFDMFEELLRQMQRTLGRSGEEDALVNLIDGMLTVLGDDNASPGRD